MRLPSSRAVEHAPTVDVDLASETPAQRQKQPDGSRDGDPASED
jgi:hypothetical protein